jgi:putative ABC transport system permease protein
MMSRRRRMLKDLDQDIRDHIAIETQENIERGMSPDEARTWALRKFGNVTRVKEETREVWSFTWLEQFCADVCFGIRALWKHPGFAIVAVLTVALGIGANTAIFSVVEGVILAPLPYPQPDRLVLVQESRPNLAHLDISYPDYLDWQRSVRSFQQMAALTWRDYDLTGLGASAHLDGMEITSGFFSTLGVKLAMGRELSSSEDLPHGAPAAVISDHLWRERFAASSQALGKPIVLDGAVFTVVGVLPPGFRFLTNADIYTSLAQGSPMIYNDRTIHGFAAIARLKPDATIAQAQSELNAVQENLDRLYPAADQNLGTLILPLKEALVFEVRGILLLILGAVSIVLLIACTNVANLLLARSTARTREFAIRSALGASRARMVRQLLTESVLLAIGGGVLGLGLAKLAVIVVVALAPASLPRADNIAVNLPVLLFAFGISLVIGILFGLAPALDSSSVDVQVSLKAGERGSTGAHPRAQSIFVIVQMALTLVLLMGSGLLLRTILQLWKVNPGFDRQHVITFKVGLSPSLTKTASTTRTAYRQLLDRIREIPGIQAADFTNVVPLSEHDNGGPFWVGAQQSTSMQDAPHALYFETGPEYLQVMHIPLLQGHFFTPADNSASEPVVVIDSVLAHMYFPHKDPVGQLITVAHWRTARVIGVVGHVKHWGLSDTGSYNPSQIYISFYQLSDEWVPAFAKELSVAVRTPLSVAAIMPAIRNVVYGTGKDQPVYDVQTMQQIASDSMASQRVSMILLGAFSVLALLLASVGIYGVLSYSVSQRIREIGIRMALGAERRDVLKMIIAQGLQLAVAGVILGAVGALLLARLISAFSRLLYGVQANDPVTFIGVSLVLICVSVLACYVPARRASRVEPMAALKYE